MERETDKPTKLTPKQFEIEVENHLTKLGIHLSDFKVHRLEKISAADGIYEIDVTARFEALGANFLVLIECKHHTHPIKRDVVQVLNDRLRAVGAQKGMIFSTVRFQSGAIEYAQKHGIALVHIVNGRASYETKHFYQSILSPSWAPSYVGYIVSLSEEGHESYSLIHERDPRKLLERFESGSGV
jgi:restriction system protein